jgi:hypothetical protein
VHAEMVRVGMTTADTLGRSGRKRGTAQSRSIRRLGLWGMRGGRARVRRRRNRESLVETVGGGTLRMGKAGEVLVVGCRREAQSNYVAEVEGMESRLRRTPHGSGIGRRHRRHRRMRRAL